MKLDFWIIFGFIGQFLFFMRFVVQWIASEKRKGSIIPNAFWYFSIAGSLILLLYSIHIKNPVFILGQSVGSLVYIRNIMFIHGKKQNAIP